VVGWGQEGGQDMPMSLEDIQSWMSHNEPEFGAKKGNFIIVTHSPKGKRRVNKYKQYSLCFGISGHSSNPDKRGLTSLLLWRDPYVDESMPLQKISLQKEDVHNIELLSFGEAVKHIEFMERRRYEKKGKT